MGVSTHQDGGLGGELQPQSSVAFVVFESDWIMRISTCEVIVVKKQPTFIEYLAN